jgi:glycosyltransferase involved in cell wall biosynthesis/GT2 family glycosyltransferase
VALAVLAQLAAEGAFGLRSLADDTRAAPAAAARSVKAIAFYLPQFHPIPENDAWWGRGFTEWSNVTRGKPLFRYHNQPRVPADLGYYDLRLEDTQVAQAELAREYGIHGFCYYYYWFNGRKLLNQPIENMLRSSRIDAGFCICWANENWSRNWDGQNRHVLMRQEYSVEGNVALIHEIIPMMKDPRWIRHRGRPVMIVYRISIIPDWPETARRWREACRKAGLGEIHLCAVRFGLETLQGRPEDHGLDAYVLFPPHEAAREDLRGEVLDLHRDFRGEIFHYPAVVDGDLSRYEPGYDWPIHRGAMLAWDNTARRLTDARVFHGATPYGFRRWMKGLLEQEGRHAPHGESLVFINAWNEWAEGTYLEPDQRWGRANLAAFRSAVAATPGATAVTPPRGVAAAPKLAARLREAGDPVDAEGNGPGHPVWRPGRRAHAPDRPTVMLCAHIAGHHLFGAERSLLDLATAFVEVGANLIVTLPSGGNVRYLEEIDRLCVGAYVFAYPQWMQDRPPQGWLTTTFADIIARHRVDAVHVNTIVLLEPAEAARRMGVPAVVHVRELISLDEPLRRAIGLETGDIVARVLARADWLMCNSRCTRTLFSKGERTLYAPNAVQLGLSENKFGSTIKFGIVSSNIPKKGVADFVEVARRAAERAPRARFVVVGPENDLTAAWAEEVRRGERPDNLRFLGYRDTPRAAMVELNVLLNLSLFGESFGRTVAEAMACGRPVIAYDWGALPELVRHGETGLLTPFRDIEAVVKAVETFCGHDELITRMGREAQAVVTRDFAQAALNRAMVDGYRRIIGDARPKGAAAPAPTIPRTTVVIAAYNAPEALRACLASVLKHTDMAANRVLVIDDASPDPAVGAVLAAFEGAPGLTVRRNADNLGYTRTVNLGLAEAGADDVVLLNADTLATPRWLEGLRAAAYCRPQVATVTAMSDNAGAFSFPDFDAPCPKPDHLSHEEYAILMTQATQGCAPPETPTGSGFCMYMRRAAVEAVGVFDADAFPRGYGEENDLCMRMLKAGWINLVSPWSFVYHVRSASFGSGKAALVKAGVDVVTGRYPDYAARVREAFAAPAMTALREAARRARTGSWEWEA